VVARSYLYPAWVYACSVFFMGLLSSIESASIGGI